ncbi:MAG: hypothetical protein PVH79_01460 [Candidatus Bathyarchaeota archaeon]|jgi:hypothetical protein
MYVKHVSRLGLMAFLIICLIPALIAYADVPTVVELELETRGEDSVLIIQVRHSSPSGTHYVDVVEVEVDETVEKLELDPQSTTTFDIEHSVDADVVEIRTRAHCTNHGWSRWKSLETEEPTNGSGGIPGFPIESIILGIVISVVILWVIWRC